MKNLAILAGIAGLALSTANQAEAQHYSGHHHHGQTRYIYRPPTHGHDSAGHMVDNSGHHVDSHGHHTGAVGFQDGNLAGNPLPYTANYPGASVNMPGYGQPIRITNPANSGAALSYSLNGFAYSIRPGETQNLINDRVWVIRFDRGGEFGQASYSLTPGNYEFEVAATGWEIYQQAAQQSPTPAFGGSGLQTNPLPAAQLPTPAIPPAPSIPPTLMVPSK